MKCQSPRRSSNPTPSFSKNTNEDLVTLSKPAQFSVWGQLWASQVLPSVKTSRWHTSWVPASHPRVLSHPVSASAHSWAFACTSACVLAHDTPQLPRSWDSLPAEAFSLATALPIGGIGNIQRQSGKSRASREAVFLGTSKKAEGGLVQIKYLLVSRKAPQQPFGLASVVRRLGDSTLYSPALSGLKPCLHHCSPCPQPTSSQKRQVFSN